MENQPLPRPLPDAESAWLLDDPFWSGLPALLAESRGPADVRDILNTYRSRLLQMDPPRAAEHLLRLLEAGIDFPTGLLFSVGPDGKLRSAPSLRSNALDWLGQIAPAMAADKARRQLTTHRTALPPAEFALHLRNFAWGSPHPPEQSRAFLLDKAADLLSRKDWLNQPTAAIAEAFDVLVYTEAHELVPELLPLLKPTSDSGIRAPALLVLERMVDRQPLQTLPALLAAEIPPVHRAAAFARLHPGNADARNLLRQYLIHPSVSTDEAVAFLRYFPNLNQSFSHNLLSSNQLITDTVPLMERLHVAEDQLQRWLANPRLGSLHPELKSTRQRLRQHLGENPSLPGD